MREVIGQLLPLAVVVAISPIPIIGVVLVLVTPRAWTSGPLFVVGFLAGLAIVGAVVAHRGERARRVEQRLDLEREWGQARAGHRAARHRPAPMAQPSRRGRERTDAEVDERGRLVLTGEGARHRRPVRRREPEEPGPRGRGGDHRRPERALGHRSGDRVRRLRRHRHHRHRDPGGDLLRDGRPRAGDARVAQGRGWASTTRRSWP